MIRVCICTNSLTQGFEIVLYPGKALRLGSGFISVYVDFCESLYILGYISLHMQLSFMVLWGKQLHMT